MLLKLRIAAPAKNKEYSFLFHHTANMDDNFNKLAIKLSPDLWFNIYVKHEYNASPYKYFVQGELKYPARELEANLTFLNLQPMLMSLMVKFIYNGIPISEHQQDSTLLAETVPLWTVFHI